MTTKRFKLDDFDSDVEMWELLNIQAEVISDLEDENEQLKQSNENARQILKKEFDFATEQRQKHLDDPVVAKAYDIIRYDMRRALDKLGGYE